MECVSRTQTSQREMCRRAKEEGKRREEEERRLADRVFNMADFLMATDHNVLIFILVLKISMPTRN